MAEALKEMFNKKFYEKLAIEFNKADKNFKSEHFVKDVIKNIENLSLNERLRNTSIILNNFLPKEYKKAIRILYNVIPNINKGYTTLVFPDYVSLFGQDDFETSMDALKYFTQFGSSEFAIREFLKTDFYKTIFVMEEWAKNDNPHVRRLSSEGSRSRLPWSFKLDEVIKKPQSTKKILEILKADTELYVKKSVANHLNDISKDNPDYMIQTIKRWDKNNNHTAWIVKHASRTLIKKGNADTLAVFDFEKNVKIKIENFKLNKTKIYLGESLVFSFDIISNKKTEQKLVIDYSITYSKKGNSSSKKVFKLKELIIKPHQKLAIKKSQLFKDFSTRKHYEGLHTVEIIINGKRYGTKNFHLLIP